ncbi:16S rRNA (cytosine(1402)-N(4))-methyltransferase [Candidatus Jorgensenbacteria bacterium GWA1_49_17]|uniref:Ribosomal RNA small subunit methyltransferase H n=2 Tax=Candidatus Joergenseniibacteriota TaxID=1752739 RepID=A0A1F6BQS3_9BACT|nr:MAG: 16S rRNA (cytosine(1402)-N(4))-methyltransferase [Candidatus Jorgensenbacteria bacterium GWC1_48_12]OGG40051.1 MAG: 16S rRNA (cytosine(1402)-N(4))-methyltransferase [Candidatus Jorgensenbacteria bacterium GWA1_49_17]
MEHVPVLLNEVIKILDLHPGEFFIDGTLGGGGHAAEIFRKISPKGTLLGIDWDKTTIEKAQKNISAISKSESLISKLVLISDNYKNIPMILKEKKLGKADGVLLDLGFSSEQLTDSGRGFSFLRDEPLFMTYSKETKPAYRVLSEESESNLKQIIREFGEERFASRIARAIKKNLPILNSGKLAAVVAGAVPGNYERGRIHPATRTFQAIRIFVNRELENLKIFLGEVPSILNPGARLAVISFHSLEDRIVKNRFRELKTEGLAELLTKKPMIAEAGEIRGNPRSRSAKLRAIKIL